MTILTLTKQMRQSPRKPLHLRYIFLISLNQTHIKNYPVQFNCIDIHLLGHGKQQESETADEFASSQLLPSPKAVQPWLDCLPQTKAE